MYILSFGSINLPLRFISNFGEIWIKLIKSSSAIRNYSFCATVDKVKIPIKVVNTKTVLSNLIQEVVTLCKGNIGSQCRFCTNLCHTRFQCFTIDFVLVFFYNDLQFLSIVVRCIRFSEVLSCFVLLFRNRQCSLYSCSLYPE